MQDMRNDKMVKNVCAVVETDRGVLAVERRKNPGMVGLVGGKREHGEDAEAALLREFYEETGLETMGAKAALLYSAADETGEETATYRITGLPEASTARLTEDFVGPEGTKVVSVPWDVLTDPRRCEFPGYNAAVRDAAHAGS
jgi:8-oxo-dGTP pyrophosphatase MutT (NUDIX family)